MILSNKKLGISTTLILSVVALILFGTFAYHVQNVTGNYYNGYEFTSLENLSISSVLGTLVCLIGVIALANVCFALISKASEKVVCIFNIVTWSIALVFSITTLCSKFINISYQPQNSLVFVLIITILGIISSIYSLVYTPSED